MDQTRTIMFPVPTSTSTAGSDSIGRTSSPSLYLIIFLTLLLLLISSSLSIFIRGLIQKRRLRSEIHQAIDRGDLTQTRGSELLSRLDTMTWSLGRWSLSWVNMLREDLARGGGGQGGWDSMRVGGGGGGVRRRRKGRALGPVPKLYEVACGFGGEQAGGMSGQAGGMGCFLPFALFHRTTNPVNDPPDDEPRHIINYNINVPPSQAIRISGTRQCICPPGSVTHLSERRTSATPRPNSRVGLGSKRESSPATDKHRGETWIARISDPSMAARTKFDFPESLPLEASFLIKMPEPEEDKIFRDRIREQEGEEVLHPPMEIGIWEGILDRPRA